MRRVIFAIVLLASSPILAEEGQGDGEFLKERDFMVESLQAKVDCIKKTRNWEEMDACHKAEDLRVKKHELDKLELQKKKLDEETTRLKKELEGQGKP